MAPDANRRPAERLAAWLGWTEGQVYTIAIGLALAVVTASVGLPPAFRERPLARPVALPPGLGQPQPPSAPNEVPVALPPPVPLPIPSFPAPEPFAPPPPVLEEPKDPAVPRPLTIVGAGWAAADAGSPLANAGVPEGGLPVAARLGTDHRRSFILLDGTETKLRLGIVDTPGANMLEGLAVVQACPVVTAGWTPATAQPFEEAPAFDCTTAAVARRLDDGSFLFDLAAIPEAVRANGFALVPGPGAPPSFQVVFSTAVLPPSDPS
ncbi:MAG: hypothetical protein WEB06_07325 [Actinomycetota bacterium]